jgi:hypothetical protein
MKPDLSTTFSVPFHRLFTTFSVGQNEVNQRTGNDLCPNLSDNAGAERYGEKCVRIIAVSLRRVTTVCEKPLSPWERARVRVVLR